MVSFPPLVAWNYKAIPKDGTAEAALLDVLKKPRSWVNVA